MGEAEQVTSKEKINRIIDNTLLKKQIGNNYKSLEQQVYKIIKDKIVYRELKPGERIIDKHLAEELDVSRSLVRQAFNILEKEELITAIPRSGFYVREITKKDIKEIYNIRRLLEGYATELAVPEVPAEDIKEVEELFKQAKEDLEEGEVESFIEADTKLHNILTDNCKNERLKKMINKYQSHYIFYRLVDFSRLERAREAYHRHCEIFEAVKDKDVELTVELIEEHIEHARDIIIENFEDYTYGN
ncbi:GntR family transcriptional regulator [Fuchsiella alkaliacetigena]|uniref:GntR family transcriptional regulator n=1 Tax=Fuchsiella alkaliacetigena TaxID=957042 RepID=UPI00200B8325|nr:GntR family transcriptional regulator [Fuchsiella alkaliacetigena]MCK8824222.1 GntR family transcriptional regulator [Fuchsiella alkaliacetigena]